MTDALPAALSTMLVARKAMGAQEEEPKGDGFSRLLHDMKEETAPPGVQGNAVLPPTGAVAVALPFLFPPTCQEAPEDKPEPQEKADAAPDQPPSLSPLWPLCDPAPRPVEPTVSTDGAPFDERRTASYRGLPAHADNDAMPVDTRALEPRRIETGRRLRDELTFDVEATATPSKARVSEPVDPPRSPLPETGAPESALATPPVKIHVSEIQTHLPAAIAATLAIPNHGVSDPVTRETARLPDRPEVATPRLVKILKFDLEPASLGSISVRMRVTHMRVDIKLDAESASTCALLHETRETLNTAIAQKGLTLESYEVALGAAPASASALAPASSPATSGQGGGRHGDQPPAYSGERGFTHEDRPGQRHKQPAPEQTRRQKDVSSVASAAGVLL